MKAINVYVLTFILSYYTLENDIDFFLSFIQAIKTEKIQNIIKFHPFHIISWLNYFISSIESVHLSFFGFYHIEQSLCAYPCKYATASKTRIHIHMLNKA